MARIGGDSDLRDAGMAETIRAFDGNDAIDLQSGVDLVRVGMGADIIFEADTDFAGSGNSNSALLASPHAAGMDLAGDDAAFLATFPASQSVRIDASNGLDILSFGTIPIADVDVTISDASSLRFDGVLSPLNQNTNFESITGSDADDKLSGNASDSLFVAGGGDDTVMARSGDDTVLGGTGDDRLSGGPGDDIVEGGTGDDTLFGGDGDDSLVAGDGTDRLYGGTGEDTLVGGGDGDLLNGRDDADLIIIASVGSGPTTTTTVLGGLGGDDNDTLDIGPLLDQGFIVQNFSRRPDVGGDGFDYRIELFNPDTGQTAIIGAHDIENLATPICFTCGTMIATAHGERPVETLRPGDRIITRDDGIQPLAWAGARHLSAAELRLRPHLRPVRIRAGALCPGLPAQDMLVSPQHRMLVADTALALVAAETEGLAAAKHMTGWGGIERCLPLGGVTYRHLLFERHQIVLANGTWSESFQPGLQSLRGLGAAQRREILTLFPVLETEPGLASYIAARPALSRRVVAAMG